MSKRRTTKKKSSAKKAAPKKKKGVSKRRSAAMSGVESWAVQNVLASDPMSAVELQELQGVLATFRATTSWPTKEQVPNHDPNAFDVPGNFEAFCIKYKIWPWNRTRDAKPFQCVRCEPKNETVYYKDADGRERVYQRRNDYYLAQECR